MESKKFTYTFPDGSIIEEFKANGKMHNAFGPARIIINPNGVRQIWKDKLGGHFFTPGPELTKWRHPTENVFDFGNKWSYVWSYEEANFITELDIFK